GIFVRAKETARWRAAMVPADIDVKAVVLGPRAFAAQMPLAREERFVLRLLERTGERDLAQRQLFHIIGRQQLVVAIPCHPAGRPDPVGHAMTSGKLAEQDARS